MRITLPHGLVLLLQEKNREQTRELQQAWPWANQSATGGYTRPRERVPTPKILEYEKFRVIGVTPAGRREYLEILVPYLLRQRHILEKHVFWLNTTNTEDLDYVKGLCRQYPDFFEAIDCPVTVNGNESISAFFKTTVDHDAIYVRLDDDIVWLADDAISELVHFRLRHPEFFLIFGNIINNSICTYLHQRMGFLSLRVGESRPVRYECMDDEGWKNPQTAEEVHDYFLRSLADGRASQYKFDKWVLAEYERFSINFMAFFGRDFAAFQGDVGALPGRHCARQSEEPWLTEYFPKLVGRPNAINGKALVSHFAYHSQRRYLEGETTLLSRYRQISYSG